jgi:hypothetical protein
MARRKAEQWASEAERIAAMPDRWVEPKAESEDWAAQRAQAEPKFTSRIVGIGGSNSATLDALTARMSAIPSMTDRAAINALAEAVADLARLMR